MGAKGIFNHLFQYKLGQKPEPKMGSYLYETFDAYTRNKEHIMINLDYLSQAKESMYKLIIHSIEEGEDIKADNNKTNLLKDDICAIFTNIKTVHIDAGSGYSQFSFSLIGFLSVLQASEWEKVTIEGKWISKLWKAFGTSIQQKYNSANYSIKPLESIYDGVEIKVCN